MNALDQIIADALAGSQETHVAMLAREVVRLREARAVVAPESKDTETIEVHGFAIRNGCGSNSCYVRKPGVGTNGPCTCIPRFVGVGTRIKLISALRANQGGADHE